MIRRRPKAMPVLRLLIFRGMPKPATLAKVRGQRSEPAKNGAQGGKTRRVKYQLQVVTLYFLK